MNKLFYGDNLDILRNNRFIADESVDLCYIDPPFNSNRNYNQIYNNIGQEDRAQAQAFVDTWTWDDHANECLEIIHTNRHGTQTAQSIALINGLLHVLGRGSLLAYLVSMTVRIAEIHRVLKETGSFYLHCDPTASHYLKLICDAIFAAQGGDFKNEIIWHYRKWSNRQKQFVSNHDSVLFYTKSENQGRVFNQLFMERAPSTTKRFGNAKIISGYDESGKRVPAQTDDEESEGVALDDVWDISRVPPVKMLYPTEKPQALLERIITASSNEGDVVFDAYCGCGTTIVTAQMLKRQWIGIDITYQSISLILRRLRESEGAEVLQTIELHGVPRDMPSVDALIHKRDDRVRKEFEKWAVLTYSDNRATVNEKKGADQGIDGKAYIRITRDETKPIILSVKSGRVGRAAIAELRGTIERENAAAGIMIVRHEPTKPMRIEAKAAGQFKPENFNAFDRLQIITVQEILDGARMNLPLMEEVTKRAQKAKSDVQNTLSFE